MQGISDIITIPGLVNVDFADVKAIMCNSGTAMLGVGVSTGKNRAEEAAMARPRPPAFLHAPGSRLPAARVPHGCLWPGQRRAGDSHITALWSNLLEKCVQAMESQALTPMRGWLSLQTRAWQRRQPRRRR